MSNQKKISGLQINRGQFQSHAVTVIGTYLDPEEFCNADDSIPKEYYCPRECHLAFVANSSGKVLPPVAPLKDTNDPFKDAEHVNFEKESKFARFMIGSEAYINQQKPHVCVTGVLTDKTLLSSTASTQFKVYGVFMSNTAHQNETFGGNKLVPVVVDGIVSVFNYGTTTFSQGDVVYVKKHTAERGYECGYELTNDPTENCLGTALSVGRTNQQMAVCLSIVNLHENDFKKRNTVSVGSSDLSAVSGGASLIEPDCDSDGEEKNKRVRLDEEDEDEDDDDLLEFISGPKTRSRSRKDEKDDGDIDEQFELLMGES